MQPVQERLAPRQQHGLAAADAPEQPERDEVGERRLAGGAPDLRRGGERLGALVDEVLEDRAERRGPGRDADLPERRVDAGGHARALRLDDPDGRRRERRVDQADAAAADHEAGEERGPVVPRPDVAHQQQPGADQREAARDEPAHAEAVGELARERRDEERQQRDGQEAQAGLERRVAERVLDVEGEVQEHREHRRGQHERGDARAVERPPAGTATGRASGARRAAPTTTNATSSSTAATSSPTISAELQPSALPRISAKIRHTRPPENVTSPAQSTLPSAGLRDSSTLASVIAIAPMPIGTLTKKMNSQPSHSVSAPPTSGPTATAAPVVAPQRPNAVPRSGPWNAFASSASAVANISAAPLPWIARATLSSSGVPASPHSSEAAVKIAEPDHEHQPAPEQVRERPARQQQRRQRERVGVDHPLQVGEARAERPLDVRQRRVHDRDVEQEHERADVDGEQGPPLAIHPPETTAPAGG